MEEVMYRGRIIAMTVYLLLGAIASASGETQKNPLVPIKTSLGNVKIKLFQKEAPMTVQNFLFYAKDGFYRDTIFHRVIAGFTADLKIKQAGRPIKLDRVIQCM